MTGMLPGFAPATWPGLGERTVWGIDPSTVYMATSCAGAEGIRAWDLVALPKSKCLPWRQTLAADRMTERFAHLLAEWGEPWLIGLEIPGPGPNTPKTSYWVIGATYVALGRVFGESAPMVREFSPPEWKKAATGLGYVKVPRAMDKTEKRRLEKARLLAFAQEVGYTGEQEDTADSVGITVATALEVVKRG